MSQKNLIYSYLRTDHKAFLKQRLLIRTDILNF
eukprot:UN06922